MVIPICITSSFATMAPAGVEAKWEIFVGTIPTVPLPIRFPSASTTFVRKEVMKDSIAGMTVNVMVPKAISGAKKEPVKVVVQLEMLATKMITVLVTFSVEIANAKWLKSALMTGTAMPVPSRLLVLPKSQVFTRKYTRVSSGIRCCLEG